MNYDGFGFDHGIGLHLRLQPGFCPLPPAEIERLLRPTALRAVGVQTGVPYSDYVSAATGCDYVSAATGCARTATGSVDTAFGFDNLLLVFLHCSH